MKIPLEKDEQCIVRLRDCFTGGYTLPQYCIDNGIKKPLFYLSERILTADSYIHSSINFYLETLKNFSRLL